MYYRLYPNLSNNAKVLKISDTNKKKVVILGRILYHYEMDAN